MARPTILIIGGGFIGKTLAGSTTTAGLDPLVVTRSGPWDGPPAEVIVGDATNRDLLESLISRASHVFLAHSGLKPAESQERPIADLAALLGPIEAVFACLRDNPGVGVTHFSSGGTVYGDVETVPTPETTPLAPVSFYGTNRWVAEEYLARYSAASNPVTVLRCSNLYGSHQRAGGSQGLVAVVASRLRQGDAVEIFGDGGTERDYVLATDVCQAALDMSRRGTVDEPINFYNCGSGVGTKTIDLVYRIARCLDVEPSINFLPDRGFDVERSVLDISKLQASIDYQPTELDEGLLCTLAQANAEVPSGRSAN